MGATVAVAIVGVLVTFWLNMRMQEMRMQRAENIGAALKVIGEGVQSFVVQHQGEIYEALTSDPARSPSIDNAGKLGKIQLGLARDAGGEVLGISVGAAPPVAVTAAQIIQIMNLPGVGDKPPSLPEANYVIRIFADKKNIGAVVYLDRTIRRTYDSQPDWDVLMTAIRKIGVHGGFSKNDDRQTFTFPLTPANDANPVIPISNPARQPGLLAVRAGYTLGPMSSYLRRDGTQAMTGNLNMATKEIVGLQGIEGHEGKLTIRDELVASKSVASMENITAGEDAKRLLTDSAHSTDRPKGGHIVAQGWVIAGKGIAAGRARIGPSANDKSDDNSALFVVGLTTTTSLVATDNISGKSVNAIDELSGATVKSRGTVRAEGDFISKGGAFRMKDFRAEANTPCDPTTGAIAVNKAGQVVSCQSGTWQISLKEVEKIVERQVPVPVPVTALVYREWSIGELPEEVDEYSFRGAMACRVALRNKHSMQAIKRYLELTFPTSSAPWYRLRIPDDERDKVTDIKVGCFAVDERLHAVRYSKAGHFMNIPPTIDAKLDGARAREMVPANPPTIETLDAKRADTYCPSAPWDHSWKYGVDLGHWDQCYRLARLDSYSCLYSASSSASFPYVDTNAPFDADGRPRWLINTKRVFAGVMCVNFRK